MCGVVCVVWCGVCGVCGVCVWCGVVCVVWCGVVCVCEMVLTEELTVVARDQSFLFPTASLPPPIILLNTHTHTHTPHTHTHTHTTPPTSCTLAGHLFDDVESVSFFKGQLVML